MSEAKVVKEFKVIKSPTIDANGNKHERIMFSVCGTTDKWAHFAGLDADEYPLGTRFLVEMLEPEPPQERIVLPEGMRWDENTLWLYGLPVAYIFVTENLGWYRVPQQMASRQVYFDNIEEGIQVIENALAEHNYFGVKKVVDND